MDRRLFLNHLRARAEDELVNHNEEKVLNYKKLPKTRILSGQTIVTFMYLFVIGIVISSVSFIFELIYSKFKMENSNS